MKLKKRLSILTALMLLFMITFPVTGAFAAENKKQVNSQKASKQEEQAQQNNNPEESETPANQGNDNEVDTESNNGKEENTPEANAQGENNPENEGNAPEKNTAPENGNKAEEDNSAEENNAQKDNASDENNSAEENNAQKDNASDENNATEDDNAEGENGNPEDNNDKEDHTPAGNDNESTPAEGTVPGNGNKSTQIHLHINQCVNPVETAYVQIAGEWEEMTNPGSSPLFKAFDEGEFIKDDVTAFKLIFTTGEELIVPISKVRVGVEAEGSVNYWLDDCEIPAEEPSEPGDSEDTDETVNILSMIRILIDGTSQPIEKVTLVMMSGKRVDFARVSELFSLTLTEEIELELIRGIEITSNGETKLILLSQIESLEIVDGVLSLQVNWDMDGELVEEETGEVDGIEEEAVTEEDSETTAPGNDSDSGNTSDGTTNEQVWNGDVLPQTGESSRTMFYVLGFLIAAGGIMLRFRNPLKN